VSGKRVHECVESAQSVGSPAADKNLRFHAFQRFPTQLARPRRHKARRPSVIRSWVAALRTKVAVVLQRLLSTYSTVADLHGFLWPLTTTSQTRRLNPR